MTVSVQRCKCFARTALQARPCLGPWPTKRNAGERTWWASICSPSIQHTISDPNKELSVFSFPQLKMKIDPTKPTKHWNLSKMSLEKGTQTNFLPSSRWNFRGKSCTLACAHFWSNEACHKKMEKPSRWISWLVQNVGSVGDSLSLLSLLHPYIMRCFEWKMQAGGGPLLWCSLPGLFCWSGVGKHGKMTCVSGRWWEGIPACPFVQLHLWQQIYIYIHTTHTHIYTYLCIILYICVSFGEDNHRKFHHPCVFLQFVACGKVHHGFLHVARIPFKPQLWMFF